MQLFLTEALQKSGGRKKTTSAVETRSILFAQMHYSIAFSFTLYFEKEVLPLLKSLLGQFQLHILQDSDLQSTLYSIFILGKINLMYTMRN